ncbi:MAG: C39 family peptidase [Nitrospirota bacterium]
MARHAQGGRGQEEPFARSLIISCAAAALLTVLITGCTGRRFAEIKPGLEARGAYIEGVPFYQQREKTCGPAALAGILEFRGRPESLERITGKIYHPELRGTLPMDMESYAREAGFTTGSSSGSFGELKGYIRKGVPVICLLDMGFSLYHQPHYVSVIGYDDVHKVFIVHDGSAPNSLISYATFNKQWVRAGYWMLVIEPRSGEARHEH